MALIYHIAAIIRVQQYWLMTKKQEKNGSLIKSFQKQIKDYRLYCSMDLNKIQFNLLDICQDIYYQVQYQEFKLPASFQRYLHSLDQLYTYVKQKTKIFKIMGPGVVMCAQYMGRVQKYILLDMVKMEPNSQILENTYVQMLQRNCKQLLNKANYLKAQLNFKNKSMRRLQIETKKVKSKQKIKKNRKWIDINNDQVETQFHQTYLLTQENSDIQEQQQSKILQCQNILSQYDIGKQNQIIKNEQKMNLEISKENPYYSKFNIKSNVVQKIISSQPYQIYMNNCIRQRQKLYFSIKIIKTKYSSISIGLMALKYFSVSQSKRQQFQICYNGYYGIIVNQSTEDIKRLPKIKEGDTIKTIFDLNQRQITWKINQLTIGGANISQQLVNYELYPYFQMQDKNDVILLNAE